MENFCPKKISIVQKRSKSIEVNAYVCALFVFLFSVFSQNPVAIADDGVSVVEFSAPKRVEVSPSAAIPVDSLEESGSADQRLIGRILGGLMPVLSQSIPQGGGMAFSTAGCKKITNKEFIMLLAINRPIFMNYQFSPGCDVEGQFMLTRFPFNMNLELRNSGEVERVEMRIENKIDRDPDQGIIKIRFIVPKGTLLTNKESIEFDAEYEVTLNMSNGMLHENKGGFVTIKKVHGQEKSVRYKLMFKMKK